MAGLKSNQTALSADKSASMAAMRQTSSLADGLLQQPVKELFSE